MDPEGGSPRGHNQRGPSGRDQLGGDHPEDSPDTQRFQRPLVVEPVQLARHPLLPDGTVDLLQGARKDLYLATSLEMRVSPAWRGAPDDCRRVLDRLEVEHLRHRLQQNGALVCLYDDFVEWGVRRAAVRLAIEQAVALGFLEITRRGYPARMEVRVPSLYRLTYVKSFQNTPAPTDEWRNLKSAEEVRQALKRVRAELDAERAMKRARRHA
jgi:hypothetical protein